MNSVLVEYNLAKSAINCYKSLRSIKMVKTNYSGLNPAIVQALNNLQYRYSGEMPKM